MQHLLKREKKKEFKEQFFGNPILLSIAVFALGMALNSMLETIEAKNFFNWCGYYFNSMFVSLNSAIRPSYPNFYAANPITPQVMATVNPWMWVRGYFLSAIVVAFTVTNIKVRYVKPLNIILLSIFTGVYQIGFYMQPYMANLSASMQVIAQFCYLNVPALMIVTFMGFLTGIHLATYFFGEIKKSRYKNGENIFVKFMSEDEWNPN
jgi:hypothetical protein